MLESLPSYLPELTLSTYIAAAIIIPLAFTVFGLTGFGSAVVASPVMAHFAPLYFVLPVQLLLDFSVALSQLPKISRNVVGSEILALLPFMVIGLVLGTTLLVNLPQRVLLVLLGLYLLVFAVRGLRSGQLLIPVSHHWRVPIGLLGGVVTAMFGTGGPIYVSYLTRRITDQSQLRATIILTIVILGICRILIFISAGLYSQHGLLLFALLLLPLAWMGMSIGSRLNALLPPSRIRQTLYVVLMASGLSLLARAWVIP